MDGITLRTKVCRGRGSSAAPSQCTTHGRLYDHLRQKIMFFKVRYGTVLRTPVNAEDFIDKRSRPVLDRPNFSGVSRFIVRVNTRRPLWNIPAVVVAVTGCVAFVVSGPCRAYAMHETDHRFTVSGYVYNKQAMPVGDARVFVRDLRDQGVEPVTTYTDGTGYYKVVLHLHNGNEGDDLQIRAIDEKIGLDETKTVRAKFVPSDIKTDRQASVNIGPVPENMATPSGERDWRYIVGGVVVGGAVAAFAWSRHRKLKAKTKRRGKKRG
jgi:hypothetical protein